MELANGSQAFTMENAFLGRKEAGISDSKTLEDKAMPRLTDLNDLLAVDCRVFDKKAAPKRGRGDKKGSHRTSR